MDQHSKQFNGSGPTVPQDVAHVSGSLLDIAPIAFNVLRTLEACFAAKEE